MVTALIVTLVVTVTPAEGAAGPGHPAHQSSRPPPGRAEATARPPQRIRHPHVHSILGLRHCDEPYREILAGLPSRCHAVGARIGSREHDQKPRQGA